MAWLTVYRATNNLPVQPDYTLIKGYCFKSISSSAIGKQNNNEGFLKPSARAFSSQVATRSLRHTSRHECSTTELQDRC